MAHLSEVSILQRYKELMDKPPSSVEDWQMRWLMPFQYLPFLEERVKQQKQTILQPNMEQEEQQNAQQQRHRHLIEAATISDVSFYQFDFEQFIKGELGLFMEPARPMRRKDPRTGKTFLSEIDYEPWPELCRHFQQGGTPASCPRTPFCPFRHARPATSASKGSVVCKHWLRALCKKGEQCEFLHEYNMKRMPECFFYAQNKSCTNVECQYLHIDADSKMRMCSWYARGFCKNGPNCRNKHQRMALCLAYLAGFCPQGSDCPMGHARFEIPTSNTLGGGPDINPALRFGSGSYNIPKTPQAPQVDPRGPRPLETVTCYRCGQRGHYSSTCPQNQNRPLPPQNNPSGQPAYQGQGPPPSFMLQQMQQGK